MSRYFIGVLFIQQIFTTWQELFHLSNKCLFSAFCVPGTVLSPGEIAVNKMAVLLCVYISAKLTLNRTTLFVSVFFVPKNTTGRLCCFC